MKQRRKLKPRKKQKLFRPDVVHNRIAQAVKCDLESVTQMYGGVERSTTMLIHRQRHEISKKYSSLEKSQEPLVQKTYEKFFKVNEHMASFGEGFYPFPYGAQRRVLARDNMMDSILQCARSFMHAILTDFDEDDWFSHCQHSGGSSIGVSYRDTSLEAKSCLPMTITSRAKPLMDRYHIFDQRFKVAVEQFNSETPIGTWYREVSGSRATTVEKNDEIRRMIAIEPTGNMFFQQGLMSLMYDRMKIIGLDVETLPDIHKERARVASITSNEATIDFSSASDCVSIPLLRYLMPPKWFHCLDLVRCDTMSFEDKPVKLNMFSTMGNAGTFPVETLVFYTLALATYRACTGDSSMLWDYTSSNNQVVSVFGDDCIVPTSIAKSFMDVCTRVGFMVNEEKSFFDPEPGFRESCGGDYFRGYDVRPFYIKAPTSMRQSALEPWLYIIMNGLLKKYRMCFGDRNYMYDKELWRTCVALFRENGLEMKLVPPYYPDDSGLFLSDDIERFDRHYSPPLATISVTKSGTYRFNYLRYMYRKRESRDDHLHYVLWLKRPTQNVREITPEHMVEGPTFRSNRRNGGYIVASGISCHWQVPLVGG
jgi:hypothetical protein